MHNAFKYYLHGFSCIDTMSSFYLTPVKGELPIHLLEVILESRLEHLKKILNGESVIYNEYVVEGSVYDNVGHFMLSIIANLFENGEFSQFFLRAEVEQFRGRLAALSAYEIRCFSKKLLRIIRKYDNVPAFVDSLQVLCQHLMLKAKAHHICSVCVSSCSIHNITLNFTKCLPLIAKRQVELKNGNAIIPCGRWKQLLVILFSDNIKRRMNSNLEPLKADPRIMTLFQKVRLEFSLTKEDTNTLMSKDVDTASRWFPPCMLNLHQHLRMKHRLSHTQRFYYSLFLKDIGMPIEEAITFWKGEYSLHPNGHHSCCHNWDKDEKKFVYGIRHMYGLEGCRKSYTSVNCQCIQSIDNAGSEGGCPFKSFDDSNLIPLLHGCIEPVMSQIHVLKNKHMYTTACMLFMNNNLESNKCDDNHSFNFTPVKYYMTVSEHRVDV